MNQKSFSITVQEVHEATYIIRGAKSEEEAVKTLLNDLGPLDKFNSKLGVGIEIEHLMTDLSHINLEPEFWKIEKAN